MGVIDFIVGLLNWMIGIRRSKATDAIIGSGGTILSGKEAKIVRLTRRLAKSRTHLATAMENNDAQLIRQRTAECAVVEARLRLAKGMLNGFR